jgi:ketol-acid reductoisomerase
MTKISDKLTKVNDNFTVNMYDNGFMVEIGGRDDEDDWKNAKILCNTLDELIAVITEATTLTRE